jgi:hypothetical protein
MTLFNRHIPHGIFRTGVLCILCALSIGSGISFPGCMSLVPRSGGVAALPNGVTEYRNPTFDNRINLFGWTFIGATTAAGAYEGYRSNIALRWTGWERRSETKPIANAALGAAAGLASSLLLTWIMGGDAPPVTPDYAAKWIDGIDDRMVLTDLDTLHPGIPLGSIRVIPRTMLFNNSQPGH